MTFNDLIDEIEQVKRGSKDPESHPRFGGSSVVVHRGKNGSNTSKFQTKKHRRRGRSRVTSQYTIDNVATTTLSTRQALPVEVALALAKSDPNRSHYQVLTIKGRVIW